MIFSRTAFILSTALFCLTAEAKIDRMAVVSRHNIELTSSPEESPQPAAEANASFRAQLNAISEKSHSQVGNGNFAFNMDITGLQTFHPFNTLSNWGWHELPLPEGKKPEDFKGAEWDYGGRKIRLEVDTPEEAALSRWLAANPHRFNLARVGFLMTKSDGTPATEADLKNAKQKVDLATGIVVSEFEFDGEKVSVKTACAPDRDCIAVEANSKLIRRGQIKLFVDFPYGESRFFSDHVGDWNSPEKHSTHLSRANGKSASPECFDFIFWRKADALLYRADLSLRDMGGVMRTGHRFVFDSKSDELNFTLAFSKAENFPTREEMEKNSALSLQFENDAIVRGSKAAGDKKYDIENPAPEAVFSDSAKAWEEFWLSGAAVDLSESTDPRWMELERRIILSQYLMRLNESASLAPQESGLVNNGWFGRLHFEMMWWHGFHNAYWGRWELFDGYHWMFKKFLPTSKERAQRQGFTGARWPKCTADFDREWPGVIHATLLWQQPHPIFFAEADYILHPNKETLEKWKDIVFESAEFMAGFPVFNKQTKFFDLGPPMHLVSENSDPKTTKNGAFELGYWRYGLSVAQKWRKRCGLEKDEKWENVLQNLAPLPVQDGLYVSFESIEDMWTKRNFEHPALIGTFGMLRGDGVEIETFKRTLDRVHEVWNLNRTWGWDFPMLAMASYRAEKFEYVLEYLLTDAKGFQFFENGLATGGPFPYLPSNGALLSAIGLMCSQVSEGEGSLSLPAPEGKEVRIKFEGFKRFE